MIERTCFIHTVLCAILNYCSLGKLYFHLTICRTFWNGKRKTKKKAIKFWHVKLYVKEIAFAIGMLCAEFVTRLWLHDKVQVDFMKNMPASWFHLSELEPVFLARLGHKYCMLILLQVILVNVFNVDNMLVSVNRCGQHFGQC